MSHRTLKVTQRTEETLRMYEIKKGIQSMYLCIQNSDELLFRY